MDIVNDGAAVTSTTEMAAPDQAAASPEATAAIVEETKYSLQELCEHAQELFGVGREVIAGALHATEPREVWSVSEIKNRVDEFLKAEVK